MNAGGLHDDVNGNVRIDVADASPGSTRYIPGPAAHLPDDDPERQGEPDGPGPAVAEDLQIALDTPAQER